MKMTLIIAVFASFALLSSCRTNVQTEPQDGEWVQIVDTMNMQDLHWLTAVYSTWDEFTGLVIRDTAEYQLLATMADTTDQIYQLTKKKYPIVLPPSPDFSQYSLVGFRTATGPVNYIRKFYINDALKQYRLHIHLESTSTAKVLRHSQNWLRVPRLKTGYSVVFDTTMSKSISIEE